MTDVLGKTTLGFIFFLAAFIFTMILLTIVVALGVYTIVAIIVALGVGIISYSIGDYLLEEEETE